MLVILFYDITDTNKQLYRQVKKISERYLYREAEVVGWNNGNNIPKISKNSSRNVNPARYSFDENIDDDFNFESQTVSNNSNRKKVSPAPKSLPVRQVNKKLPVRSNKQYNENRSYFDEINGEWHFEHSRRVQQDPFYEFLHDNFPYNIIENLRFQLGFRPLRINRNGTVQFIHIDEVSHGGYFSYLDDQFVIRHPIPEKNVYLLNYLADTQEFAILYNRFYHRY